MKVLDKLQKIFDTAPWLIESNKIVNIPIKGMDVDDGFTWKELYELIRPPLFNNVSEVIIISTEGLVPVDYPEYGYELIIDDFHIGYFPTYKDAENASLKLMENKNG